DEDLGIELTVKTANWSHIKFVKLAKETLERDKKPHFLIFKNFKKQGPKILNMAEENDVNVFMFNAGLLPENIKIYGKPREKLKRWIGQMIPDDKGAGYDLARILIDESKEKKLFASDGKIHMIGLSGLESDSPTILRNQGLTLAVQEDELVMLHQIIPADWQFELAKNRFPQLLKRYPDSTIVWAANDTMGLGVVAAAKTMGIILNNNLLTGGIDWTLDGLQAVNDGEFAVSIGGHFMEGGWVLLLLYDYYHGIDFVPDYVDVLSRMSALTKQNIQQYLQHFSDHDWSKIDFKKFSKKENSELKEYEFSIDAILKQFE
ncbi:hypothetical protein BVX93_00890, partial [bacterium B13(2017)]